MAQSKEAEVNLSEILPTDMSSIAEIEIPSLETSQSAEEATPTPGKRKRTTRGPHESKDPNAPRRPQTAYMMFTNDVRKDVRLDHPDTSVSDRAKIIGRMWADLEQTKKKEYQQKAQEDKERYIQEYVAYQETDIYKEFIRKKFPNLQSKKPKTDDEKSATSSKTTTTPSAKAGASSGKTPLSCQQQFVPGLNIPIFSDEFLKHNREMEAKLRKLRQSSSNLEEENALLSRHVDSMKSAVLKVQNEVKKQEDRNGKLQGHLVMLREILVTMFKEVPLPGSGDLPTVDTIDAYMGKLQQAISNDPDKYPDLMVKVSDIAKQLDTVLKPRLEQDGLTLTEEGGGASEQ
ncbi:high mobility group protein 20A-like [Halichondria panicea]|uniref:high mobility group protein 20A-like n=1 Tax=Halichondria panicea TaxID=6063 RepID=UPI00312B3A6E